MERGNGIARDEWRWALGVTLVLVVATSLPYLVAWGVASEGARFTGLLFNPQDGNSYIAKMRQGWEGAWVFRLPYTPEPQEGAPVYLFYLFLGHAVRWTGLPLILVYHAARVVGGVAMLVVCYALAARLSQDVGERRAMFTLAALGSGLGWLVAFLDIRTSDLWVPEAFPIYALLVNAHFPLAMGLMASMAYCVLRIADSVAKQWAWRMGAIAAAVVLGAIQPFGLVAAFGGLGVMAVARVVRERAVSWRLVAWVIAAGVAALPYPLYMLQAMNADPALAAWNAQNLTDSPPLWDWALSYGVVLVLAVLGGVRAARRGSDGDWLLLGWVVVTLVGMYLPLPPPLQLQRRLSLGLGVPLGLLAGLGWWRVARPRIKPVRRSLLHGLVVITSALTPLFLVLAALLAAWAGNPWFYLSEEEWAALDWLREEGRADAVVLCAPQTGIFIPAWAGQPVVYGHPFETVDAARREAQVRAYWTGEMEQAEREAFLRENRVAYVWVGPRESALGGWDSAPSGWTLAFDGEGVRIYDVGADQ